MAIVKGVGKLDAEGLLEVLKLFVDHLPPEGSIAVSVLKGIDRFEDGPDRNYRNNGTQTLEVLVNGGARDTLNGFAVMK